MMGRQHLLGIAQTMPPVPTPLQAPDMTPARFVLILTLTALVAAIAATGLAVLSHYVPRTARVARAGFYVLAGYAGLVIVVNSLVSVVLMAQLVMSS